MGRLSNVWRRYHRENRFLVGAFLFLMILSVGAFYLIQRAQETSPEELTNRVLLFVLWYLDISLILILSFILLRNVVRLVVDRRSGVLGSRFRTKLVLTYVGLTFVPVILIFLIATNLLQGSIDRWFSAPVETILRGGAEVTVQVRELIEDHLQRQAAVASEELGRATGASAGSWSSRSASSQSVETGIVMLAYLDDTRTRGNAATEVVKYFLQLHYGLKVDLRNHDYLVRDNFYNRNS